MRVLVLIQFWCCVVAAIVAVGLIGVDEYPREREARTMGHDVGSFLLNTAFAFIIAWVLWG